MDSANHTDIGLSKAARNCTANYSSTKDQIALCKRRIVIISASIFADSFGIFLIIAVNVALWLLCSHYDLVFRNEPGPLVIKNTGLYYKFIIENPSFRDRIRICIPIYVTERGTKVSSANGESFVIGDINGKYERSL